MNKQAKKRLDQLAAEQHVRAMESNLNRARSVTVGTAFGGTTEIMMRGEAGNTLWCVMQPVEVIELIHQLAANVGCHLALKPRKDFASWRNWKYTEEELANYRGEQAFPGVGWAPHVNSMGLDMHVGTDKYESKELKAPEKARSKKHETVATEKSKNRRSAKRTSAFA